ncbi:MAG: Fic family protein [Acidimicrobiia bacterium]|nr:Fic family protein [Acidimicrobiia bacterium]MBP8180968.1 Fic family protein [Acidimicrobiia bacterium]
MRTFEETHPWINFKAGDLNSLGPRDWMLLGEAKSKCEHLAGAPLRPEVAAELYGVALIKGAHSTTAIEGNTLTQEQVAGILDGTYKAPPSREYQEHEVRNVLHALERIDHQVTSGEAPTLSTDLFRSYNAEILSGTNYSSEVKPGELRDHSVVVANYRGAPPEDCEYLLGQLATWLEGDTFKSDDPEIRFALTVASAVFAHLYLAWIHPFGDGNGRTARLVEYLILARSGLIPIPAAHLLSNHYNLTRDQYYRELAEASKTERATSFLRYATQGLIDGLRDEIDTVRRQQLKVTWVNYVHERMSQFPASPARDRQRALVLAMPPGTVVPRNKLEGLTPELAVSYARAGERTLSRDLNRLAAADLLIKARGGWQSNEEIVRAFLPPIAS